MSDPDHALLQGMATALVDGEDTLFLRRLRESPRAARLRFPEPHLFSSSVCHWIYRGDTLLHLAAAGHRPRLARALLEAGAEPDAAYNMRRSTPLHYAADGSISSPAWNEKRQVETLRILLQAGANLHGRDQNGATPLHRAVRTRCAAAVALLLGAGSDPLGQNKAGSSPFHLAVQNTGRGGSGAPEAVQAQRHIIQTLLTAGADPEVRDGRGRTVLESARSAWIREILARRP